MQYDQYNGLLIAIPNGGSRNPMEGARLKREGVVRGVADRQLIIARGEHHGLFIEMKTHDKSSKQKPHQKEWQAKAEAQGYKYVICRDVDEFINIVNDYLNEQ